jgi:hypothetical protein
LAAGAAKSPHTNLTLHILRTISQNTPLISGVTFLLDKRQPRKRENNNKITRKGMKSIKVLKNDPVQKNEDMGK